MKLDKYLVEVGFGQNPRTPKQKGKYQGKDTKTPQQHLKMAKDYLNQVEKSLAKEDKEKMNKMIDKVVFELSFLV